MFAALVIVLVALTLFGLRSPNGHYAPVPDAGQVRWMSVELYPMQSPGTVPQPLVTARGEDAAVIAQVLSWLRTAPIAFGNLDGLSVLHNVPIVTVGLIDGRRLQLVPALECTASRAGTSCGQMAGYVSFWDGGSGRWTVKSTQLAAWLAGGWRAYFRLGDYAERDAIIASQ
jgi:hypothetical protein